MVDEILGQKMELNPVFTNAIESPVLESIAENETSTNPINENDPPVVSKDTIFMNARGVTYEVFLYPYMLSLILKFYENNTGSSEAKKTHLNLGSMCALDLIADLDAEFKYWEIYYTQQLESCCLRKFESLLNALKDEKAMEQQFIDEVNFKENFGKYFSSSARSYRVEDSFCSISIQIYFCYLIINRSCYIYF